MTQTLSADTFYNLRLNFRVTEPHEIPSLFDLTSSIGKSLGLPEGSVILDVRLTPLSVLPDNSPMPLQDLAKR